MDRQTLFDLPLSKEKMRKINRKLQKRTGRIISKAKLYKCLKCGKIISSYEIEIQICPCCKSRVLRHKNCNGRVTRYSLTDIIVL